MKSPLFTLALALLLTLAVYAADRTVVLAWDPNPTDERVTVYRVYQSTNAIANFELVRDSNTTNVTLSGVAPCPVWFRVTAVNELGESDPSAPIFLPASGGLPSPPSGVGPSVVVNVTNVITIQLP